MSNKKKDGCYTIVYVYGPTRCKDSYLKDQVLNRENGEFVKIGKTDFAGELKDDGIEDLLKKTAIERCQQESKTGISDWCSLYDVFLFPQTKGKNVDDTIRNILCNDVYSLDNSKAEIKDVNRDGDIKPGREFVYGVSRNHIRHAIESYCFQLIISCDKSMLEEIQTICNINAIMTNEQEEQDSTSNEKETKERQNRDISMVISPDDVVYLVDARDKGKPVTDEKGKQIEAVYVGNKKFKFNDEDPMFASPLAIDLISRFKKEKYNTISGNHCWQVEIKDENQPPRKVSLAEYYDSMVKNR